MSPEWFDLWLPAFLTTILSEAPIIALFLRDRVGLGPALALGLALQLITHPIFWLLWESEAYFFFSNYTESTIAFEGVIYLVEAAIILAVLPARQPWQRVPNALLAFLASATANSVSVLIGMLSEG